MPLVLDYPEFLKCFLREERFLAAFLLSATGDMHAAEDLLQNVAVVLWQKRAEYDETRPFRAWATGMAQIEVLRWRQRMARSREVLSEETIHLLADAAVQHADAIDERNAFLAECLQSLAEPARRVLELKYGHGCAIRDISAQMKRTVAAIEMMLVRSRRGLRECIERKMAQASRGFS